MRFDLPAANSTQQPSQNLLIAQVVGPAVGGADRAIQRAMGGSQPGRPRIVEVGQRALLQLGFGQAGRVEPATKGGVRCWYWAQASR